jgi:hypothetical protein
LAAGRAALIVTNLSVRYGQRLHVHPTTSWVRLHDDLSVGVETSHDLGRRARGRRWRRMPHAGEVDLHALCQRALRDAHLLVCRRRAWLEVAGGESRARWPLCLRGEQHADGEQPPAAHLHPTARRPSMRRT